MSFIMDERCEALKEFGAMSYTNVGDCSNIPWRKVLLLAGVVRDADGLVCQP